MKAPRTLRDHLSDIRSQAYDLHSAARLLETMLDAAPVSKIPVALQHFINEADWLSRQIAPLAASIATAADDAEGLALRGAS